MDKYDHIGFYFSWIVNLNKSTYKLKSFCPTPFSNKSQILLVQSELNMSGLEHPQQGFKMNFLSELFPRGREIRDERREKEKKKKKHPAHPAMICTEMGFSSE